MMRKCKTQNRKKGLTDYPEEKLARKTEERNGVEILFRR